MQQIEQALVSIGMTKKGKQWTCPWHPDKNPSASLIQGDDGNWRLKCFACGKRGDIHDILGTEYKPKGEVNMGHSTLDKLVEGLNNVAAVHRYTKDNKTVSAVIRLESGGKKEFRQASLNGSWQMKAPPRPSVLYNYDKIKTAPTVVVVEGEKAADALIGYDFPATTSAGGASNAKGADWSVLDGKQVILWPDNDDPGRNYMKQVESIIDAQIKWCEPELLEKGDAWDFVRNTEVMVEKESGSKHLGLIKQIIRDELGDARGKDSVSDMRSYYDGCISGDNLPVEFDMPHLSDLTQALKPGTVTILCGEGGSGKSFLLTQWMIHWVKNSVPVAALFLEDGVGEFHLPRALAVETGEIGLIKGKWVNQHPDETRKHVDQNEDLMRKVGSCISAYPSAGFSLEQALEWMEKKSKTNRILIVDPVTILTEDHPKKWIADADLITKSKDIARVSGSSVIFVTHPKSGIKGTYALESLAGGSAYPRFSHTVLWLENHIEKQVEIRNLTCMGSTQESHCINKTLHMFKTRNGAGANSMIGLQTDGVKQEELGIICKKES